MKRVILSIPSAVTFDTLTQEQQDAINSVFGQHVIPMPGTVEANGRVLCDAVTHDNFDPAVMPALGLDWPVVGLWQWDGVTLTELTTLNQATYLTHLPEQQRFDEAGSLVGTQPAELVEVHRWAGWPACF